PHPPADCSDIFLASDPPTLTVAANVGTAPSVILTDDLPPVRKTAAGNRKVREASRRRRVPEAPRPPRPQGKAPARPARRGRRRRLPTRPCRGGWRRPPTRPRTGTARPRPRSAGAPRRRG